MRIGAAKRYYDALRYIPIKAILRRASRELRIRKLLRSGLPRLPDVSRDVSAFAYLLADRDLLAAAQHQRRLVESFLQYNRESHQIIFLATGDALELARLPEIPWNEPQRIPPSDLNRCYYASFFEQAILEDFADPQGALIRVYGDLLKLHSNAKLRGKDLPIPWQALPISRRLVNLQFFLALLVSSRPSIQTESEFRALLRECERLKRLLKVLREDDLGYNHLASELFAECVAAHVFGDKLQLEEAVGGFVKCVRCQVGDDGMQRERSATYQAHVLGHVEVLRAARAFGTAYLPEVLRLSEMMRSALSVLTHPSGEIALFNDSATGDGPTPKSLYAQAEKTTGVQVLADAGFYRLNGGSVVAVFDAGPCGADDAPGHAHADFLSVDVTVGGTRLLSDPGVSTYKAGPERDWTRSASTHNGPRVMGFEPMDYWGAFRVGRRGCAYPISLPSVVPLSSAGWQSGYEAETGKRVGRWLGVWPDEAVAIVDVWLGEAGAPGACTFLIPTAWHLSHQDSHSVMLRHEQAAPVRFRVLAGSMSDIREGRYYPYGPRRPEGAHAITINPVTEGGYQMAAVVWTISETLLSDEAEVLEVAPRLAEAVRSAVPPA